MSFVCIMSIMHTSWKGRAEVLWDPYEGEMWEPQ